MRAKELADRLLTACTKTDYPIATREEAQEIASLLDRLDAIESAAPEEVREIAARDQWCKDCGHRGNYSAVAISGRASPPDGYSYTEAAKLDAITDRAALLAIVQRQAGEIAGYKDAEMVLTSTANAAAESCVDAILERDAARAEVERLKERCAKDDAGVTIHACPPPGEGMMPCCGRPPFEVMGDRMTRNPEHVNCDRERLQAEVEKLKSKRTAIATENARLTNELARAQTRADVIAEGVRLYRDQHSCPGRSSLMRLYEWEREHGHEVGK